MTDNFPVLVDSDNDLASVLLSTTGADTELILSTGGEHRTDTELSEAPTALTPDSVTLPTMVSEVTSELVCGDDDLATVVLITTGADGELTVSMTDSITLLAVVAEVSTELTDDDAIAALCTTRAAFLLTDDFNTLGTHSDALLALLAEVSRELLRVDDNCATTVLSTAEVSDDFTALSDDFTALMLDPVPLPTAGTNVLVGTELVHSNEDSASSVQSSAADGNGVSRRGLSDNISDTAAEMLLSVLLTTHGTSEADA